LITILFGSAVSISLGADDAVRERRGPPPRTAVHVPRDPFQIREKGRKRFSSACKTETCDVIGDGDLSDAYRGSPLSLLSAARASAT